MDNILISTKQVKLPNKYIELFIQSIQWYVYINSESNYHKSGNFCVIINGYIQPRNQYFEKYGSLNKFDLIYTLYKNYKNKFIEYIKGNFTVILIHKDSIDIFTDHFGLNQCYIYQNKDSNVVTNSFELFKEIGINLELDAENIAVKSLLHRMPGNENQFKHIKKTKPASQVIISNSSIKIIHYWAPGNLLQLKENINYEYSFDDFAKLIKKSFSNFISFQEPDINAISLTGGKDSRTGFAALKANGISPHGFTYGNPDSRDAIYAKYLAEKFLIQHRIYTSPDTENYFNEMANTIINSGNPDINLHRSHRLYAFREMAAELGDRSAYYAGYMAGEFLMGIYYDNLVFTKFLTDFWDCSKIDFIKPKIDDYFHRTTSVNIDELKNQLTGLNTFNSKLKKEDQQFYSLFEIGIPHHTQDIFIANKYFDLVYPFFIDIDFLEALFQSRFSFFYTNNKTKNLLKRYRLFEFNLNIQHLLFPDMDSVPFGKRGSYNSREFLRGKYYWASVKATRYVLQRKKYPPTFVYGQSYRNFLLLHLEALSENKTHVLHELFDIERAITHLKSLTGNTNEVAMHKFTNIVQLYLQLNHYNNQH